MMLKASSDDGEAVKSAEKTRIDSNWKQYVNEQEKKWIEFNSMKTRKLRNIDIIARTSNGEENGGVPVAQEPSKVGDTFYTMSLVPVSLLPKASTHS
jgi:hypothetical protein